MVYQLIDLPFLSSLKDDLCTFELAISAIYPVNEDLLHTAVVTLLSPERERRKNIIIRKIADHDTKLSLGKGARSVFLTLNTSSSTKLSVFYFGLRPYAALNQYHYCMKSRFLICNRTNYTMIQ